jgi:predicted acyltransferase
LQVSRVDPAVAHSEAAMHGRTDPKILRGRDFDRDVDIVPKAPYRAPRRNEEQGLSDPAKRRASLSVLPAPAARIASVDALRGFSMFAVLGADIVARSISDMLAHAGPWLAAFGAFLATQFTHADWHGARFYDLVFPLFIFVTGVSIVFSLPKLVAQEGKWAAHRRVLRRFVLLFALGVICYGGIADGFGQVRLGGVLQRIALCYLFAALLFLNTSPRGLLTAFVAILAGYWALMTFVPVPGIGAGSFAPEANLANWIDAHYLPGRKWNGAWDPEGILTTLPAIGTCLLGVFAGLLLKNPAIDAQKKSLWLVGAGLALTAAGLLWSLQFPINKYLWTSSFVLVAGGFAVLLLGAFHELIDVRGYKTWAVIFIWVGASAIVLYVFNMVVGFYPMAQRIVGGDLAGLADAYLVPGAGEFIASSLGIAMAVAAAGFLYRRKIFLRV